MWKRAVPSIPLVVVLGLVVSVASFIAPSEIGLAFSRSGSVLVDDPNCQSTTLPAHDRDTATPVVVSLGFAATFYGITYTDVSVADNGNVSFDGGADPVVPWGTQSSSASPGPMIAPFYADVDVTDPGTGDTPDPATGQVHYGHTTYEGHPALCVDWFTRNQDHSTIGVGGRGRPAGLNVFQLLLVGKANPQDPTTEGDFDAIFNYDTIQWETETSGHCPQAGFARGSAFPTDYTEVEGSGQCGALLDSNPTTGLANNTNRGLSQPDGRWIFSVTAGEAPSGGDISGRVTDPTGAGLAEAPVSACRTRDGAGAVVHAPCRSTLTDSSGYYRLAFLPDGAYTLHAYPPVRSILGEGKLGPVNVVNGTDLTNQDFTVADPVPPPPGTSLNPSSTGPGGARTFIAGQPVALETTPSPPCKGGSATWTLTIGVDDFSGLSYSTSGPLTEQPPHSGHYEGTVLVPTNHHGAATITITITCPNGSVATIEFSAYIDPSGVVKDTNGALIPGAVVTLFRADGPSDPFSQVPDQSVIMSPGNRTNPDVTDAHGHFGWDVMPGYYYVRAEAPGCTSPADQSQSFVDTEVLPIPPPVTDLVLVVRCPTSLLHSRVTLHKGPHRLKGRVTSDGAGCVGDRGVVLRRLRAGIDRRAGRTSTGPGGAFRFRKPHRDRGRYYAKVRTKRFDVDGTHVTCEGETSPKLKL